jgi:hypothetical protein
MRDLLGAEIGIEFPFELGAVIGLHLPDRQGVPALQLLEEVLGVAAVEACIREGQRPLAFDVNGGVEIQLEPIEFPDHRVQLYVSPVLGVGCIAHPRPGGVSFPYMAGPLGVRIMVDPPAFLEEQTVAFDDLANRRDRRGGNPQLAAVLIQQGLDLLLPQPRMLFS